MGFHAAIQREWTAFQAWLLNERNRQERRRTQTTRPDEDEEETELELFQIGRREWLRRTIRQELHPHNWVMTPAEKFSLQQTLSWTHREMVDAYAEEYARLPEWTLGATGPTRWVPVPSRPTSSPIIESTHRSMNSAELPSIRVIEDDPDSDTESIFDPSLDLEDNVKGTMKNLVLYTHCLMLQQSNDEPSQALDDFREFASDSKSLISDLSQYYSDLDRLFNFLRPLIKKDADSSHAISTEVHYNIADDITTIIDDLTIILRIPESSREFIASRGPEAQALLDLLQDLLDQDSVSEYKPLISKTLLRLSLASSKHPRCFPLTGLETVGGQIAGGGFGDIWKGLVGGQSVSVKIMRVFEDQDIALALKEFSREAIIWRQLCHPNLLPFFGLFYREKRLCLASPWMENGNIMQYLIKHPGVARLPLILDVALGLQYLHEENIVHGDLKAINILVTPSGRACICDFGLSSIVNEITLRLHTTVIERGGTARYWAPELLDPDVTNKCHFGSDVYAFACMCYEVWTGNAPFYEVKEMAVMLRVLRGARPSRPASCTGTSELDALWKLLQDCWEAEAAKRPTAPKIVERLVGPSIGATTTSSTTDWDDQLTSRFRRSLQARPLLPSVAQIEALLFGDEVAQACVECKEGSPSPQPVA